MCQRHDWFLHDAAAQSALADVLHTELCRGRIVEEDSWYDDQKDHWRTAGTMLANWLALGWTPAPAPTTCAICSLGPSAPIHTNCYNTVKRGPCLEGQHPFVPPAPIADAGERDRLLRELAEARFRPIGDNHNNANICPYCRATLAEPSAEPMEASR